MTAPTLSRPTVLSRPTTQTRPVPERPVPEQPTPDHPGADHPGADRRGADRPAADRPRTGSARAAVSRRPIPVSAAALTLLDRSAGGLLQACAARTASERYVTAHLAALRSAAAVLAVRGRSSRGGPRSVWDLLPRVAPELTEWAAFFAATAARRAALEAGRLEAVTPRDADDLLRDAEAFQHAVEATLGLPQHPVLPDAVPSCT